MATIEITNLRLRTIIGFADGEKDKPQDVVVNLDYDYDAAAAVRGDSVADAVDYKALKHAVINEVEGSRYDLLESLTAAVLETILAAPRVERARVRIDKPHALRFADSVAVTMERWRGDGA
jgi:D-erythro-7,8-dihydroneopterin triphosphate epimerase